MVKVVRSVCRVPIFASQNGLAKLLAKRGGYPGLVFGGKRDDGRLVMKPRYSFLLLSILTAIYAAWQSAAQASSFAYVSLDGENKIVVYALNDEDRSLIRKSETELKVVPGRSALRRIAGFFLRRCDLPENWLHFASRQTTAN